MPDSCVGCVNFLIDFEGDISTCGANTAIILIGADQFKFSDVRWCGPLPPWVCRNCGSDNLTTRDDSDPANGYSDPMRVWCLDCERWAD